MEEKLTIEQMQQRSADARKVAKEMERRLRNVMEPRARKAFLHAINIMYTQAKKWRDEAKRCRESVLEYLLPEGVINTQTNLRLCFKQIGE